MLLSELKLLKFQSNPSDSLENLATQDFLFLYLLCNKEPLGLSCSNLFYGCHGKKKS